VGTVLDMPSTRTTRGARPAPSPPAASRRVSVVTAVTILSLGGAALVAVGRARHDGGAPEASPEVAHGDPRVARLRYVLSYDQDVEMTGQPAMKVRAAGAWTTTPRQDGALELRFAPTAIEGPAGTVPAMADVDVPVALGRHEGVVDEIGFPDGVTGPARNLMTGLATTFQYSARDQAGWRVDEEDLTGRYQAVYVKRGGAVHRSRPSYLSARAEEGLSPAAAAAITPSEDSSFVVDEHGVVTARVELDLAIAMGDGLPAVRIHVRGRLDRQAVEWVEPVVGRIARGPIAPYVDEEAGARNAAASALGEATLPELLAAGLTAGQLDPEIAGNQRRRSDALYRLALAVRLDPGAAAAVADAIRAHAADEPTVRLLAGALSSTNLAAGTDALAGLVGGELPAASERAVIGALSLSVPPTAASLAALQGAITGPEPEQSALGLGSHIRQAGADLGEQAAAAAHDLVSRYGMATSPEERRRYAVALGNAGTREALPGLRAAITGGDLALATAAIYSLRFIAGADVDDELTRALANPDLAFDAVRAIAYRDPARWLSRLEEARARYPEHEALQSTIQRMLGRQS
jgi:hypothetical protein